MCNLTCGYICRGFFCCTSFSLNALMIRSTARCSKKCLLLASAADCSCTKTTVYAACETSTNPHGLKGNSPPRALNIWPEYVCPPSSTQMLPPQGDEGTVPLDSKWAENTQQKVVSSFISDHCGPRSFVFASEGQEINISKACAVFHLMWKRFRRLTNKLTVLFTSGNKARPNSEN